MNCDKCGKPSDDLPWYHVSYNNTRYDYCSRRCLIEGMAPEVTKAIVVTQWIDLPIPNGHTPAKVERYIPTPEEEERMRQ